MRFGLLSLFFFFSLSAYSQETPSATPTAIPSWLSSQIPPDAQGIQIHWEDYRGIGVTEAGVLYRTAQSSSGGLDALSATFEIFAGAQDQYRSLWKLALGGMSASVTVCRLDLGQKTPFIIEAGYGGASVGGGLTAFQWDGNEFKKIPPDLRDWGWSTRDLRGDGHQEVILNDRYMEDKIYEYEKGRWVLKNAEFPGYYAQGKNGPDMEEGIPGWLADLKDPDSEKHGQDAYGLSLVKFKSEPIVQALIQALGDPDEGVQLSVVQALIGIQSRPREVVPALTAFLRSAPEGDAKWWAVIGLGYFGAYAGEALPLLGSMEAKEAEPKIQEAIQKSIGQINGTLDPAFIE